MAVSFFEGFVDRLNEALRGFPCRPPVSHIYHPLDYARRPFLQYCRNYARRRGQVMLLGMNPGPWGMAQTGVPFGAVAMVRDWLRIDAAVGKPPCEHPKRPVDGFRCDRNEVSGMRLWGWAQATFVTPETFFSRFFVYNYCPLLFLEETGRNRTPDKLPASQRDALLQTCDDSLRELVAYMNPARVIGIGTFAQKRAIGALGDVEPAVGRILHPSPASPAANRDWAGTVTRQLQAMEIDGLIEG
ncbi:MAG: uracil-DNA glycosylase family protein [Phycisphaerae bacterium]